jgi:putative membrane protein
MLSAIVSALHVLALALGLPSVFLRGRALEGPLDRAGLQRLFAADTVWGVAAALWLVTGLLRAFAG